MIAYAPNWHYVESRDFLGLKDEEYGITTKEYVQEIKITKITKDTIFGTDKNDCRTSVKKDMARTSRKACFKLLRDLKRTRGGFCYA